MYRDLFIGIVGFYSKEEGDDSSPVFSASMLLTALCTLNLLSAGLSIALLLVENQSTVLDWIRRRKLLLLLLPMLVASFHLVYAKRTKLAESRRVLNADRWKRVLWSYVCVTVANVALAFVLIGGPEGWFAEENEATAHFCRWEKAVDFQRFRIAMNGLL